jgi:hypothetical protein
VSAWAGDAHFSSPRYDQKLNIMHGKAPLIKISPKKTWEGFLGAWFFTVIHGFIFTNIMARYSYFICPVNVS